MAEHPYCDYYLPRRMLDLKPGHKGMCIRVDREHIHCPWLGVPEGQCNLYAPSIDPITGNPFTLDLELEQKATK